MEKDINNSTKVFVPTQKQLEYLYWLNINECIKLDSIRDDIGKAVCIIARMMSEVDDDVANAAAESIRRLGYIHYELKDLES